MRRPEVIAWVLSVATGRRRSQAQAPAALTAAALSVGRAALAALGRHLAGGAAAEHRIERAWRPCADGRVEVGAAMAGVVDRRTRRRREPLPVARGWGDGRPSQTRTAAAVRRGRAVPRVRAGYPGWRLFRSRNGPGGGSSASCGRSSPTGCGSSPRPTAGPAGRSSPGRVSRSGCRAPPAPGRTCAPGTGGTPGGRATSPAARGAGGRRPGRGTAAAGR